MKHVIFITLIAGAMILGSCRDTIPADSAVPSYDLLSSTEEIENLAGYIEEVKVVQIKADSMVFISPGKLLVNGDEMIALSGGQVYRMDTAGVVLNQVGRLGNGPGEYLSIADICFNTDKSKILCQDNQNRVLEYDANSLEFIRSVDSGIVGMSSNAVVPYGRSGFALLVNNPDVCSDFDNDFYCLKCYNRNGHLVEEMLKREDFNIVMDMLPHSIQGPDNTYFLSFIPGEGTFYKDSSGVISPFVHLSFGKKSLPFRYAVSGDSNPWDRVAEIFKNGYYKCISTLCSTDHLIYCYAFGGNNSRFHFLIDPKGGKGIRWRASVFADVMAAIASDGEYFYYRYTPVEDEARKSPYYYPDILRTAIDEYLGRTDCAEVEDPFIVKVKYSFPEWK